MLRRYLLFPFLGCLLISCSTPEHVQRQVIVRAFDFSPYTSKGFLFTPLLPTGDYESIGLVVHFINTMTYYFVDFVRSLA